MKTPSLSALLLAVALSAALFASSETDRRIETAAKSSYNYRTVLVDHVKVKANDGIVTLTHSALKTKVTTLDGVVRVTGNARSDAEKALVTKLAQDVRGTKSVTNDMVVKT